jgi:hypothetical protein
VFNKTDIVYPRTSEYSHFYYAEECSLFRSCKGLRRAVLGKVPRFTADSTGKTMIADDVIRNIAFSVEELYYPKEFADDWESVLKLMGNTCRYGAYTGEWTNVGCVLPESGNLGKDAVYITAYNLASAPQDKAIANVEIAGDTAIDSFVLKDGKVFDCAVRIVNKSEKGAKVSLPKGFVYEKFRGTKPLHIPAASTNLLTITRTKGNTFLISREELVLEVQE